MSEEKDNYSPLIILLILTILAALALEISSSQWNWNNCMHNFMGLFLLIFSMFKLFNLTTFADGFSKYDIIASRSRIYGYLYPFIELTLGLGYLSKYYLKTVYIATIVIMLIGSVGVLRNVLKGSKMKCACMGTVLQVPLSTVTLVENVGMGLMALLMLLTS
ncbi:MAG: hypothetical protein KBD53_07990 [Candidatus Omnitrophica bacterium]|nr:hypothetical protein [Candidatus Omnitrophota bacterium]